MSTLKLSLSSQDCEMLLCLNSYGTLSQMSEGTGLDKSYLSKRLSKIAATAPVLEKVGGKWKLNSKGLSMVRWFEEAAQSQQNILIKNEEMTFATTQIVSERIMLSLVPKIKKSLSLTKVLVLTSIPHLEEALLSQKIDFALTCHVPVSPEIRYKRLFKSPFVIVTPHNWKMTEGHIEELFQKPYISHSSMNLRKILGIEEEVPAPFLVVDHMSGVREAVLQGIGWSILPLYAIEREEKKKEVRILKELQQKEEFQLWWHPERSSKASIQTLIELLS